MCCVCVRACVFTVVYFPTSSLAHPPELHTPLTDILLTWFSPPLSVSSFSLIALNQLNTDSSSVAPFPSFPPPHPLPPPPAEAPGHFLSGPPAAPHHHQPHRPLPPSERSAHAQAFPRATHDPGHALGAALPLQSMRPTPPPEPAAPLHIASTATPLCLLLSTSLGPSNEEGGVRTPHHCLTPPLERCVWEWERAHWELVEIDYWVVRF